MAPRITHALITGASAGLGAEFARQLAARGVGLTLVARREDALHELAAQLPFPTEVVAADLTTTGGVDAVVARLEDDARPVDLLVLLNAMIPLPGETFNAWWSNTDLGAAQRRYHASLGLALDAIEVPGHRRELLAHLLHLAGAVADPRHQVADGLHHLMAAAPDIPHQRFHAARRLGGPPRQLAHLAGDHGEAAPVLTGTRRLDGGVQRQQVGLLGDLLDQRGHAPYAVGLLLQRRKQPQGLPRALGQGLHVHHHPVEGLAAVVTGGAGAAGHRRQFGGATGDLLDGAGDGAHARRGLAHHLLLACQALVHAIGVMRHLGRGDGRTTGTLHQVVGHAAQRQVVAHRRQPAAQPALLQGIGTGGMHGRHARDEQQSPGQPGKPQGEIERPGGAQEEQRQESRYGRHQDGQRHQDTHRGRDSIMVG